MVKEELVEGIRQAISKGESIEKAMMSFYSAGYLKQDIEEAAAAAQSAGFFQQDQPMQQAGQPVQQAPMQQASSQPAQQQAQQPPLQVPQPQMIQPGVVQRVSAYGPKPSKKSMVVTIALVVVLLILIGILITVILFKDEISTFLGGLWRALF